MKKIIKNDQVVVITGKDKGKVGKVLRTLGERVVVEGLNLVKRHVRPNPNKGIEGGVITKEASVHVSNVALVNPQTNKADKVGIRILEDGKKVRFFKSNGEQIK